MNVLIIDDSKAIRRLVGRIMKELGFEVSEAGDGKEGLEILEKHGNIDLVLVDWNMPVMNGLDFIKAVRSHEKHADLAMIMITTESEMERMAMAFVAGVNEYIMKPFTAEMIREKMEIIGVGIGA